MALLRICFQIIAINYLFLFQLLIGMQKVVSLKMKYSFKTLDKYLYNNCDKYRL